MSDHAITLTVNGTTESLTVPAQTLLVDALREELSYTGPKVGCESGRCGACTVHLDDEAVKACTMLAVQADGSDVRTIEGLANSDDLHPVQEQFSEHHGLQCGFCTPGMVLTATAFLDEESDPDESDIRDALKGNLCRCTGYNNIVSAVDAAADELGETTEGSHTPASGEEK
jgi:carbon-monoxide dehydrogenase small subunit